MKTNIVAFAVFGLAAAQLEGLPTCAQGCVTQFTSGANIGGCPQLDVKCICSSSSFLSDIACCLAAACNEADQKTAVDFAINLCKTQGVAVPTAVTCSSTTAASTSSTSTNTAGGATTSATAKTTLTGTATTTASSAAPASTSGATATPNMGPQAGTGSGVAGLFGGLLAALALL